MNRINIKGAEIARLKAQLQECEGDVKRLDEKIQEYEQAIADLEQEYDELKKADSDNPQLRQISLTAHLKLISEFRKLIATLTKTKEITRDSIFFTKMNLAVTQKKIPPAIALLIAFNCESGRN